MEPSPSKISKIPVLKKAKILKPIKHDSVNKYNEDQFKFCRNCCKLNDNLSAMKCNLTTLLKENNFLRQQLAIANQLNIENSNTPVPPSQNDCEVVTKSIQCLQNGEKVNATLECMDELTTQPFCLTPGHPFRGFDVNQLDHELEYSHEFHNRKARFYGDVPYRYGDTIHEACNIPKDSYLLSIVDHVKTIFPHYAFNSVLINKYENGNSHIPLHSDNETSIRPNSSILTISLGETRIIKFQPKNSKHGSEISITLQHGDVFTMSSISQQIFKHGIPKDQSKSMRISLTFRDLIYDANNSTILNSSLDSVGKFLLDLSSTQPSKSTDVPDYELDHSVLPHEPLSSTTILSNLPPQPLHSPIQIPVKEVDTIFISSSMFADLNPSKLSSDCHKSAVFFYRGATAGGICHKLQNDVDFKELDTSSVKQIFLLCGTNDIDNILNVQKYNHSNINVESTNYDAHKFEKTVNDIYNLVNYLHERHFNAKINILNLLPRASISRNSVINDLNHYIVSICHQLGYLNFINTEHKICLFSSSDGFRKYTYFKRIGSDNVHLNNSGITRLGKHLKYLLHLDSPRRWIGNA